MGNPAEVDIMPGVETPRLRVVEELVKLETPEEVQKWLGQLRDKVRESGVLMLSREANPLKPKWSEETRLGAEHKTEKLSFVLTDVSNPDPKPKDGPAHYGEIRGTLYEPGKEQVDPPEQIDGEASVYRSSQDGWVANSHLPFWAVPIDGIQTKVSVSLQDPARFRVEKHFQKGKEGDAGRVYYQDFTPLDTA